MHAPKIERRDDLKEDRRRQRKKEKKRRDGVSGGGGVIRVIFQFGLLSMWFQAARRTFVRHWGGKPLLWT